MMVVLMVLLAGVSSYGFAKLKEPVPLYQAVASVKIERITNMADFLMGGFWSSGENIATQAFIITSFPVLAQTAKVMGWIPEDLTENKIRQTPAHLSVIQKLKSMVQAEQQMGTNIVNIQVTSRDRNTTAQVANAFAEAFHHYNIQEKNRQTFETKGFIALAYVLSSIVVLSGAETTPEWQAWVDGAASYQSGDSREALQALEDLALKGSTDAHGRETAERALIALLTHPSVSYEAKRFACRQLAVIGTETSLPALTALLQDPATVDLVGEMPSLHRDAAIYLDKTVHLFRSRRQGVKDL